MQGMLFSHESMGGIPLEFIFERDFHGFVIGGYCLKLQQDMHAPNSSESGLSLVVKPTNASQQN
jgi:hypothetical protein